MSRMKALIIILLLALCMPAGAEAVSYTLAGAIERALKANPTMEQQLHALESAKMNVGVAQSYFWPRVSLVMNRSILRNSGNVGNSDQLSSDDYSYGLRLTLNLFAGFTHLNTVQQSLIEKEIAEWTKKQAEMELIVNVKMQYFGLLQARRNLRQARDSVKRIQTQLKSSEAFAQEELVPYVNVLQNRVDLSRAKEAVINAENLIETIRLQLNRYLGYDHGEKVEYKGELEDFPRDYKYDQKQALDLAMKRRPDVVIARKSVDVSRKRMYATAGQALPQVDLTYDTLHNDHDYTSSRYSDYDRTYYAVGLNFTWTFFEGGRTVFGTLAEREQGKSLYAAYKNTLEGAKTDVLKSIRDLDSSRQVFETAKEGIASANESYAQARYRYENGIGTITELLDSQNRLTEAEVSMSKAMADYQTAYARYIFYMGGE